ncbi:diacylglycerol/lipid kinase family protein [Noviherbaspirillum saxi]|uniref:Diacylglycerol kinase n=1 Tax=Noviherbaspirillum saxi TaxID=2320863 RepID=A0A3A3FVA1_9BURK|nr:diacylglycerol kinase family protein [Noviherbaspirillum saxi]RJF99683.1 diacylglycerol kinase [Noviherbaspirillum saxi]
MTGPLSQQAVVTLQHTSITVILNAGAGGTAAQMTRSRIEQALSALDYPCTIVEVASGQKLLEVGRKAVLNASQTGGIVVAAGGDGTVNTIASLCCEYRVPLGIIPAGTFNYFARDLGIPEDPDAAAKLLLAGDIAQVSVGYVNGKLFLNNASFGLYSKLIRNREEDKARFGRFRVVAVLSALFSLLSGVRPFGVQLQIGNESLLRKTSMVFVANNLLQLSKLDTDLAGATPEDRLAVFVLRPTGRLDMLRLLLRGAFRNLASDPHLETFCTDAFDTETRRRHVDVVVDGEIVRCATPLSFRVARHALGVIVPQTNGVIAKEGE